MSEKFTKTNSKTGWNRVNALSDDDIDTSDIPELDASMFENAQIRLPKHKEPVTLRLDADVLDWYRSTGKGYQTRINAVLRLYMESKKAKNQPRHLE
jgi:uncharacterized protein (DUF4415 family)